MEGFEAIKTKYVQLGMKERNIEYAIDAVEYGTEQYLIIKNLTSNVRNESKENAELLLKEIIDCIDRPKDKPNIKPYYSSLQQKIYDDYNVFSSEKLLEYSRNPNKYQDEVIEVINDILIERNVIEGKPTFENIENIEVEVKQRSLIVTWYLYLAILANIISLIFTFARISEISYIIKWLSPSLVIIILSIVPLMNVFFLSRILQWKKYGFKGYVYCSILIFCFNLYMELGIGISLAGLSGIAILYFILQIEINGISAWDQLE